MTLHAALTGDALAVKVMVDGSRRVRELIPVVPGSSSSIERTAAATKPWFIAAMTSSA
jgi:hypothetical protein